MADPHSSSPIDGPQFEAGDARYHALEMPAILEWLRPLEQAGQGRKTSAKRVGGKAAMLGRLLREGFPVPVLRLRTISYITLHTVLVGRAASRTLRQGRGVAAGGVRTMFELSLRMMAPARA